MADLSNAEVFAYWRLAARWAADYKQRSKAARRPLMRATMAENAAKWQHEQRLAAEELTARLERAQANV